MKNREDKTIMNGGKKSTIIKIKKDMDIRKLYIVKK